MNIIQLTIDFIDIDMINRYPITAQIASYFFTKHIQPLYIKAIVS